MCNNKYNTTTKVKLSEMARLDEVRFLCALACISIDLTKVSCTVVSKAVFTTCKI